MTPRSPRPPAKPDRARALAVADPDRALKTISMAEAGEKHWARAWRNSNGDDPFAREQLHKAIDVKIETQVGYIIFRDGLAAEHVEPKRSGRGGRISVLKSYLPEADPGDLTAHRWRKRFFSSVENVWAPDEAKIAECKAEAKQRATRICELEQAANYSSESIEWYTPARYIEAAREVLGEIDLDPASSPHANLAVRAAEFFTKDDDGLARDWFGRVFMNPPYGRTDDGRSLAAVFCNKAIDQFNAGNLRACIILINSLHSQQWQAPLFEYPLCLVDHRIQFVSADGEQNKNPTFQNMFVYLGRDVGKFADVFSRFGYVVSKIEQATERRS